MMEYTYTVQTFTDITGKEITNIIRSDHAIIPIDLANMDYQAYLQSLKAGG